MPDNPDLGDCRRYETLRRPARTLQDRFGRIAVRSAYRSAEVNGFGNDMQRAGKSGYNCAVNEANYAGHIWDRLDAEGCMGATACIVVPSFWDRFNAEGDWQKLAWWIHDHLPYSSLYFFPKYWAFNITWHERPVRRIDSYVKPSGCLTKPEWQIMRAVTRKNGGHFSKPITCATHAHNVIFPENIAPSHTYGINEPGN